LKKKKKKRKKKKITIGVPSSFPKINGSVLTILGITKLSLNPSVVMKPFLKFTTEPNFFQKKKKKKKNQ